MPEKMPVVSIIMATFNRAHLIIETIESIRNQTFKEFECLIVDDGSEDNTKNLLDEIALSDARFIYTKRPEEYKKGLPGCRNYGLDICRGKYIMFCDDDDFLHPLIINRCLDVIENNDLDLIKYGFQNITCKEEAIFNDLEKYNLKIFSHEDLYKLLSRKINIISCNVLFKSNFIGKNRFDEAIIFAEEYEFYNRIFMIKSFKGGIIDEILYFARKHVHSMTGEYHMQKSNRREGMRLSIYKTIENLKKKNKLDIYKKHLLFNMLRSHQDELMFFKFLNEFAHSQIEIILWKSYYRLSTIRIFIYKFRKSVLNC